MNKYDLSDPAFLILRGLTSQSNALRPLRLDFRPVLSQKSEFCGSGENDFTVQAHSVSLHTTSHFAAFLSDHYSPFLAIPICPII